MLPCASVLSGLLGTTTTLPVSDSPISSITLFSTVKRSARTMASAFCSASINPVDDQTYAAKWIADLDLSYAWGRYIFGIGAENLFDTFPDKNKGAGIPSGQPGSAAQAGSAGVFQYPINSPVGFNGRFPYTRVQYRF